MTKVHPIQARLNSLRDDGGGILKLAPGAYFIEQPLHVYRGTSIFLDGTCRLIAIHAGPAIINGGSGAATPAGYAGHGDITLSGGTITREIPSSEPLILLRNAPRLFVNEVTVSGFPMEENRGGSVAIQVNACEHVRIRDCIVTGGMIQVGPAAPSWRFGKLDTYDKTGSRNVVIDGCAIDRPPVWIGVTDDSVAHSTRNFYVDKSRN